jgi:hypothetical protein
VIPAGTNAILFLPEVHASLAGIYSVLVSNAAGAVTSDGATLTVKAAPACAPPPDGLVAWWTMNGNGEDMAGSATFLFHGAPVYTTGETGQSLVLDGTRDYGRAEASADLNVGLASGLSIEAWINPAKPEQLADVLEWNNGQGAIGTHLSLSVPNAYGGGPGSLYANLVDTWGVSHQITSEPGVLASRVFQHVALTYDKTTGLTALYVNGARVALTNLGSFTPQTSYDLYLGMRPSRPFPGPWFAGAIDELSLYTRAPPSEEVETIFAAAAGGKCRLPRLPVIPAPPQSIRVPVGGTALFTVAASGTRPFTFQWLFEGASISNATTASLVLTNVQPAQAGGYSVVVANPIGSVTSSVARLGIQPEVQTAPVIAAQPEGGVRTVGGDILLSVEATGSEPMTFQWSWNGARLAEATNRALQLTNLQFSQAGTYLVTLRNRFGTVSSHPAVVNVNDYQGGAVSFANTAGSVHAFVYDVDATTKLEGAAFLAQLYAGTNETSLQPVGAAVPFGAGERAGLFFGGTRYIPAVQPGGVATVQVRAWECASGPTFETARRAGGKAGVSDTFTTTTGGGSPPIPPALLLGLRSFSLQPGGATLSLTKAPGMNLNTPVILEARFIPADPASAGSLAGSEPKSATQAQGGSSGTFQFTVWGEIGVHYVIESSTDLRTWTTLTTVFNEVGPIHVTDPAPKDSLRRFYRVRARD